MNGYIHVSRNDTEEVGEIIRALSPYYDIYIDRSERNIIKIQYCIAETEVIPDGNVNNNAIR